MIKEKSWRGKRRNIFLTPRESESYLTCAVASLDGFLINSSRLEQESAKEKTNTTDWHCGPFVCLGWLKCSAASEGLILIFRLSSLNTCYRVPLFYSPCQLFPQLSLVLKWNLPTIKSIMPGKLVKKKGSIYHLDCQHEAWWFFFSLSVGQQQITGSIKWSFFIEQM